MGEGRGQAAAHNGAGRPTLSGKIACSGRIGRGSEPANCSEDPHCRKGSPLRQLAIILWQPALARICETPRTRDLRQR